jgi:hypothetical protein
MWDWPCSLVSWNNTVNFLDIILARHDNGDFLRYRDELLLLRSSRQTVFFEAWKAGTVHECEPSLESSALGPS